MIEKLFLTGPSGSGKTTNLIQLLDSVQGDIGGFVVQRIRSGERVLGYAMTPAKGARQVWVEASEPPPNSFLTMENEGLRFHPERFTADFLQLTSQGDLILLDEIGGMELLLPEIRLRLAELLNDGPPLLAVWKSKENLMHMIHRGNAPASLLSLHQEIELLIQKNERAAIVSESPSQEMLLRFLKMNGLHKDLHGGSHENDLFSIKDLLKN